MRDRFLRGVALSGAIAALATEALSCFHLLRRGPLAAVWLLWLAVVTAALFRRRGQIKRPAMRPAEIAAVGVTAWLSPPNSADAMAYHLPRVVYWAQAGSVAFFPTPYYNQVMLAPLDEYLMLHSYLLSGGDRFVNLLAFAAFSINGAGGS